MGKYLLLVGFGRPCAARTRTFGLIATPNGALRAPPPITASLLFSLYSKNKNIPPNSGRPREGLFSFNSTTEAREYTECQAFYTVVRIGSPTPSTARECCSTPPPLDPRGETHSLPDEGVRGTNSDDGAYTLVLQVYYNYNTSTIEAMKYNVP
jgi:hypothetical protein